MNTQTQPTLTRGGPKLSGSQRSLFWGLIGVIYLSIGCLFYFRPEAIFYLINFPPKVFNFFEPIPDPSEAFTLVLSASFFILCGLISLLLSFRARDKSLLFILFTAKALSATGFTFLLIEPHATFATAAGALTEGIIGLFLLLALIKHSLKRGG